MNRLAVILACFCVVCAYTPSTATDTLSLGYQTIQWYKYRNIGVSSLLQKVYETTGQNWKIYRWRPPSLFLIFPYSESEDLQVEVSVEVPEYEHKAIPYWQTDIIMQTLIISMVEQRTIPRIAEQAVSDYLCLMTANRQLHEGKQPYCGSVPIDLGEDPERLDPHVIELLRQSCEQLRTAEKKATK